MLKFGGTIEYWIWEVPLTSLLLVINRLPQSDFGE
jgi:hypothetical protein